MGELLMDGFWNFIFYSLPWPVQLLLLAIPVGIAFYFAVLIFGWERVRPFVLPILGVLAALGFASKLKQEGYNDRRAEEEKALDRAEEIVDDERQDVQKLPDVELDQEVDKWTRK
jgi:hypothetical protein